MTNILTWASICLCLMQSAMFSGLNLAFFSLSRLRLEVEVENGNKAAKKVLAMRKDSNFLLTTILWGNVSINVLLTLLSDSVMTGYTAFLFSTILITFGGEILPQAYFSRNALRMASLFAPLLRFYQILFYVVAKPSAKFLDWWLGKERIEFMREHIIHSIIARHVESEHSEVNYIEGRGALNFLEIDDISAAREGTRVNKASIISLPTKAGLPVAPAYRSERDDPFLRRVQASGKKWVILVDKRDTPHLVLDADGFLRSVFFEGDSADFYRFCHQPIVVDSVATPLGELILKLKRDTGTVDDKVIEQDVVLVWTAEEKRVITGADILGRLLRGIELAE